MNTPTTWNIWKTGTAQTALSLALSIVLLAVCAGAMNADENQHTVLSAEILWNIERIGSPVISPDGRWVVAPVTRYTIEDDKGHTDLWLFAADGSIERPLTRHGSAEGQPVFSPDGARLAFVSRRDDEAPQLYILPLDQPGEAYRMTNVPTGVNAPKWVGEYIYFISRVFPDADWTEMKKKFDKQEESHVSARLWNELPYSHWDTWLEEDRQAHLYRARFTEYDTIASADIEPISLPTGWELPRSTQSTANYDVAPDGSLVAFTADSRRDGVDPKFDIFLVEPGSAEARNITETNEAPDGNPLFSPDGSSLAYTRQHIKGFYADTRRLVLYDIQNDAHREVTTQWDRSAGGLVWAPDGSGLYGSIDDAGTSRIYFIGIDGGEPRSITDETDFGSLDISHNGVLVALNQSFLYPARIVLVHTDDGDAVRLDTLNDDLLATVGPGTYESVVYTGANGAEIQMWVHYPPGFDENKQYPLFLLIHGGPHNGVTDSFHYRWNAQTFASWGYVTAWHNFHGSSGFGQEFTDAINPDWLTLPYEDTMLAAEWFAGQPWIDADRMVAGGGSYGGYLSSILVGREHPFNALLIHAPVYNMYSQLAADFAVHTTRFGNYWEHDIYDAISPHYYAEQFHTPSLIIHGQLDYRVPVGQSFELFRTLRHKGIDARLIYFPDENHWILKPNNSLYWYEQVRKWIGEYAPPGGR
jgi:dipeptidyl aminopeptidase/acylaminoacyl peptidase